jgi:hypothetical protein
MCNKKGILKRPEATSELPSKTKTRILFTKNSAWHFRALQLNETMFVFLTKLSLKITKSVVGPSSSFLVFLGLK